VPAFKALLLERVDRAQRLFGAHHVLACRVERLRAWVESGAAAAEARDRLRRIEALLGVASERKQRL
jgi:hypothetical protein